MKYLLYSYFILSLRIHFLTYPLQLLNGFMRNLIGNKYSMSSANFLFVFCSGRPDLWLTETFSTFFAATEFQHNSTGSKISKSSTKFVFFGPKRQQRWSSWPLISRCIKDFFSASAEQNSTERDKKADLNALYHFWFSGPIGKSRWSPWQRYFRLLYNQWTGFN